MINASILAQMANNEIGNEEVLTLLGSDLDAATISESPFTALDKLRAANALKVATSAAVEAFRPLAKEQFQQLFGDEPGDQPYHNGFFRMYDTFTYTWENVRLSELTNEQRSKMTLQEIATYEVTRDTLQRRNELFKHIKAIERELAPLKPQLKGLNESLATLLPDSKAIHRKTVIQVL